MSHDPSQAQGIRAIQIDVDNSTVLSDDIVTHSASTISTKSSFFIEAMRHYIMANNTAGLLVSESLSGYAFGASSIRCNGVSSFTTVSDDCAMGCALSNQPVTVSAADSGSVTINSLSYFRSFWRIA